MENVKNISGIVTVVKRYYSGVIFTTEKGRKIYAGKDVLESILKCNIIDRSDFEKALLLIGSRIEAKGKIRSWYGGKYRCYLEASQLKVHDNIKIDENVEEIAKKCLYFALKNESEKRRERIINNLISVLHTFPEKVIIKPIKGIKFPTLLALYRLVTGRKLLPFSTLPACLEWILHEMYEDERKISLKYSEAVKHIQEYFISIPEDPALARKYIAGKLVIIDDKKNENTNNDFIYTTWQIFKMLKKVVDWTLKKTEKTEEKHDKNVRRIVSEVLINGKYQPESFKDISVKAIPVFFAKNFVRDKNLVALSGSAGAGKTTFLKNLSEILNEEGESVYSYALTRSAAGVVNGETIRQLQETGVPDIAKYVFIDEAFMLDLKNFCSVISEVKNTKILFSGDPEQSPPPQGFEVFKNVVYPILQEKGNVIRITSSHRFPEGKLNIVLFPTTFTEKAVDTCLRTFVPAFEKSKKNWLVITLFHWKEIGTRKLNQRIRVILGKPDELTEGERVIITRSIKAEPGVYIGKTICLVKEVEEKEITVEVPGKGLEFKVRKSMVAPAYALEVYMSQGLETDYAVFFIPQIKNEDSEEEFKRKIKVGLTRARDATFVLTLPKLKEEVTRLIYELIGKEKVNLITISESGTLIRVLNQFGFKK